ncbi:carbohydrate binding domain-containing protein [Streptomyces sp. NPDC060048]|uniref:carbohydrate binding domain-containing protein n=1 Tax=unclassified Streptomyces TaxID=2593676 RepID=UPI0036C0BA5A
MTIKPVLRVAFGTAPMATASSWTDVSQWLDLAAGIRCTRGAADELAQTQPSTLSLTLDNPAGRFSAGRASSPYYPYVRPNCPVQLGLVTLAGKNFIRTPGFEGNSMDGWANSTTAPAFAVTTSTTRAHSGTYSLLVVWAGTGTGGMAEQTVYGLDVGKTYTLSGWVWVPAGDPAVRWLIDGASPGTASAVTGAWTQITKTFTATSTSHTVQLTTNVTSPTAIADQVWLDDVQLEVGSSATSLEAGGAKIHWRFYGLVNEWDASWVGLKSKVSLTATDLFKALSKEPQLGALLAEEIKMLDPVFYYPLTEPSTSVSAGDIAGVGAGSLTQTQVGTGGSVAFSETAGPAATAATVARFTPASATDGIRLDADLGTYVEERTTAAAISLECWFQTSVAGRHCLAARSASSQDEIVIGLNGSGYLIVEHTETGGTRTVTTVVATNFADGAWHHVFYDQANRDVYIDGGSPIDVSVIPNMDALRYLAVGGYSLWDGAIGHVALYAGNITPAEIAAHYDAGATGYAGEDADDRVLRLARYPGVAGVVTAGTFSPVASQGAGGASALELMRVVEATEGGCLATDRGGPSLLLQSRTVRYDAPIALSLHYGELETDDVKIADDDQKILNQYTVVRPGGATQRVVSADSVATHGPAPKEATILRMTDSEVLDAANWQVSRYAVPQPELRELPIQAYAQSTATYRALLDADISTLLEVTNMPDEAPAATLTVTVEGYVESIGQESHHIAFHTSRADGVWVLDSTRYSVLGSTTRLAY